MDIFSLLTIWIYGLIVLFCLHAVASAACKAVVEVTGSSVSDLAYDAYTWVIANPVWAWEVMERFAPASQKEVKYFKF